MADYETEEEGDDLQDVSSPVECLTLRHVRVLADDSRPGTVLL